MALIQTPNLMYYYYNEFARSLTKLSIFSPFGFSLVGINSAFLNILGRP